MERAKARAAVTQANAVTLSGSNSHTEGGPSPSLRPTGTANFKDSSRARHAHAAKLSSTAGAWILDSGANIVVVPPGDPAIIPGSSGEPRSLTTAVGRAVGTQARVTTPFGNFHGMVLDGSPRLLPMSIIANSGFVRWRGTKIYGRYRGRPLSLRVVHGTPETTGYKHPPDVVEAMKEMADSEFTLVPDEASPNTEPLQQHVVVSAVVRPHDANVTQPDGDESSGDDSVPTVATASELEDARFTLERKKELSDIRAARAISKRNKRRGLLSYAHNEDWHHPQLQGSSAGVAEFPGQESIVTNALSIIGPQFMGECIEHVPLKQTGPNISISDSDDQDELKRRTLTNRQSGLEWRYGEQLRVFNVSAKDIGDEPPPASHYFDHFPKHPNCPHCRRCKATDAPYREGTTTNVDSIVVGDHVQADTCGHWPTTLRGENYLLVVAVKGHELRFAFPMTTKSAGAVKGAMNVLHWLLKSIRRANNQQHELSGWVLETDQGGEFDNKVIAGFLVRTSGIWRTVPTARHVAGAESAVRQVCEGIRTLLSASGLPSTFWSFAAVSYCYNWNSRSELFRTWLKSENMLVRAFAFGELVDFVHARHDKVGQRDLNKAQAKARPAAFLGPHWDSRKGCFVLYLTDAGTYAHVLVTWENVQFRDAKVASEVAPQFAFTRVYKDLQLITAPGERLTQLGAPDLAKEPKAITKPLVSGEKRPDSGNRKYAPYPLSDCPACAGRNRTHRRDGDSLPSACIYSGITHARVSELRRLYRGPKGHENAYIWEVGELLRTGCTWEDAKQQYIDNHTSWDIDTEALPEGAECANGPDIALLASFMTAAMATDRAARRARKKAERGHGNYPTDEVEQNLRKEMVIMQMLSKALAVQEEPKTRRERRLLERNPDYEPICNTADELFNELDKQILTTEEYEKHATTVSSWAPVRGTNRHVRVETDKTDEDYAREANHVIRAHVTRALTRAEQRTSPAMKAMQEEMNKVVLKGTFGRPIRRHQAKENGTVSGMHMLSYIKGWELEKEYHTYKGRLVCLGDRIWKVLDGSRDFTKGEDLNYNGDVASLGAFRTVAQHAALHGYKLRSADVKTAYLCAKWPSHLPTHYLEVSPTVYATLPEDYQRDIMKLGGPRHVYLPMERPLYGHPLSGFFWLAELAKFLRSKGWVLSDSLPGHWTKYTASGQQMQLIAYVDDLLVSGPEADVNELWASLQADVANGGGGFELSSVGLADRFLGVRINQNEETIHLDLHDYILETHKCFEDDFEIKVRPAKTPMESDDDLPQALAPGPVAKEKPLSPGTTRATNAQQKSASDREVKRVQQLLGRLLWICRTCRPDVSFAVGKLATRVASWDEACTKAAARLVGYLKRTALEGVAFRGAPDGVERFEIAIHTDASWKTPKSHTGVMLVMEAVMPTGERKPLGLLDWVSKKQGITADSSGAAELIAAHMGLRTVGRNANTLSALIAAQEGVAAAKHAQALADTMGRAPKVVLWTDNSTVLAAAKGRCNMDLLPTKHLQIRAGCLADAVALQLLDVGYVPTDRQLADGLTKPLERLKLEGWKRECHFFEEVPVLDPVTRNVKLFVARVLL